MVKHFITFGAGNVNYYEAGNRLINQAYSLNLFDKIYLYTDLDLKADNDFWSKHSTFIENNKRGYGYWLWKPYIIKKTMENMKDGDILMYLDCGCEIDTRKKDIINNNIELVKTDYIIGTYVCIEKEWNKMDLVLKLDMLDNKYLDNEQHQAGLVIYLVCDKTRDIVNKWYELGCDYHNIDDSPSINKNLDCFREHRHDQSIFSLLTKKYDLYSKHSLSNCIESGRNISGISRINYVKPIIYNMEFAYVTFVNNHNTYINLMKSTIKSVELFSKYPIIVYCVDIPIATNPFIETDRCIIRHINSYCIKQKKIFYTKPYIIIDAIEKGLKSGYYIEADDLLTPNGDSIVKFVENLDKYPISPIHPDNVNIPQWYMNNLNVRTKSQHYIHAHVLFKNSNLIFLKEWFENCLKSEGEFWDESVLNCMYWKHNLTNHYLEIIDPWYQNFYNDNNIINKVITLHGCKNVEEHSIILNRMIEFSNKSLN